MLRNASKDVRMATADDIQEALIDFLDPVTLQPVVPTTTVQKTAPTVDVVITVPVGTWLLRIQGRTATGEVAGSRYESSITVLEGQITEAAALLNPAVNLAAIQVNPGPATILAQGTTGQFTAVGILTDLTTQAIGVTWSSSNPTVANISATGLVTANSAGTAVISARAGNVTGSSVLTVTPTGLKSLQVTPNPVELSPGLTQQLTATGIFEDNTNQNVTAQATWSSSAPNVASVNASTGLVRALAAGEATVTATLGNLTATTNVKVKPTLVNITLTPANLTLPVGLTQTIRATGVFSDNTTEEITVSWASGNAAIATVSNTGLVSAVNAGTTTVTATSGNVSATASVRVEPLTLTRLTIAPLSPTVPKGATQAFNATGVFNNNTTRDVTNEVTWTSTNTSVLGISNANGTRGQATAVNAGTSVVEATLDGVSAATTATVSPASLISIAVTPVQPEDGTGDLVDFKDTGTYSDGTTLDITTNVTWSSGNTTVVIVSNADGTRGNATSVTPGTTSVTATLGDVTGSTTFTTKAPLPPPVIPSPSPNATITAQLVSYENGTPTVGAGSSNAGARGQAVSSDGRYVAFIGPSTVDGLTQRGVFRRDTQTGAVVRCSVNATTGVEPSGVGGTQYLDVAISADGSRVAFTTNQALVPRDTIEGSGIDFDDVYVRDLNTNDTILCSRDVGGFATGFSTDAALSGDGQVVAFIRGPIFPSFKDVMYGTVVGGTPSQLLPGGVAPNQLMTWPRLNFDGSVVAMNADFDLAAEGLTGGRVQVYRWAAGVFTRISRSPGDIPTPPGDAQFPSLNNDGNTIVFQANYDLLTGVFAGNDQIWCWSNPSTVARISVVPAPTGFTLAARLPSISGDGRYVGYLSLGVQVLDTPPPQWGVNYAEGWILDRTTSRYGRLTWTRNPSGVGGSGGSVTEISLTNNGAGAAITWNAIGTGTVAPVTFTGQANNVVLVPNVVLNGATPPDKPAGNAGPGP